MATPSILLLTACSSTACRQSTPIHRLNGPSHWKARLVGRRHHCCHANGFWVHKPQLWHFTILWAKIVGKWHKGENYLDHLIYISWQEPITQELQDLRSDRMKFEPAGGAGKRCCTIYMSLCVTITTQHDKHHHKENARFWYLYAYAYVVAVLTST